MSNQIKFIVSHAPFWHDGSSISQRSYHIIIAALPAVLFGIFQYGLPAVAVVSLSVSCAIFWELAMNFVTKRSFTIGDGNAALIGLLFAMLVPATLPWLAVLTGTFVAVIIGKQIFGGIGSNAFNPVVLAIAILMVSWKDLFDFDEALLNYDLEFAMLYPIAALKHFGPDSIEAITAGDLLLGKQTGGIGATFGLGLIIGGIYLIIRGFIRWEICLTFLVGVFATALIFNLYDSSRFAGPVFHTLTGYTLIGAFFLATEDSSSPVNFIPMLIFGAGTGALAVLIRNIGAHVDGVIYAILVMNLINPILDKIRPKAIGRVN
ncbi:MAG: RnfABCDGE type electron transport complex subunit D [Deltaproteobacteria bacterium]|nr:RnfABCDGE type electron transport complex subunit D [Deltaproteobacteria bacterium]